MGRRPAVERRPCGATDRRADQPAPVRLPHPERERPRHLAGPAPDLRRPGLDAGRGGRERALSDRRRRGEPASRRQRSREPHRGRGVPHRLGRGERALGRRAYRRRQRRRRGAIAREAADNTLVIIGATEKGLLSRLVSNSLHLDVIHDVDCSVLLAERPSNRSLRDRLFGPGRRVSGRRRTEASSAIRTRQAGRRLAIRADGGTRSPMISRRETTTERMTPATLATTATLAITGTATTVTRATKPQTDR